MKEEKWNDEGRDRITIGVILELGEMGFEFVVSGGHIVSVLMQA